MRKTAFILVGALCAIVAVAQTLTAADYTKALAKLETPIFDWVQTTFDFGKVKANKPVNHTFTFTNTGNGPLVISSVKASCGCTVAEYSKDPIPVNGEGFVKATYNAAAKGVFTKTVTINANTEEGTVVLTIKGEVID
jgi:hypothetical protein